MTATKNYKGKKSAQGISLMLVLVQIFVLAIFVAALGTLAIHNLRSTSEKSWQRQARFAAYAGIQASLAELETDPAWAPGTYGDSLGNPNLRYTIDVLNNLNNPNGEAVLAPDNTWVPPGTTWLRSRGYLGEVGSYQTKSLVAVVGRGRPVFDHAIFGENQITVAANSQVNSYSSSGGYAATSSSQVRPALNSHLATNSQSPEAVYLTQGSWVDGNVYVGLAGNPTTGVRVDNGGQQQGEKLKLEDEKQVFRFRSKLGHLADTAVSRIIPAHHDALNFIFPWETEPGPDNNVQPAEHAYNQFRVQANNPDWGVATNLFSGEYLITGDLDFRKLPGVSERTVINVHANDEFPVVLYVQGNVYLSDVVVNGPHGSQLPKPRHLQIYTLRDNAVCVLNNSELHGVVAGKGLTVNLQNGSELFGSILASNAIVADSQIHYDRDLMGVPLNGLTAMSIISIKEASIGDAESEAPDIQDAPPKPPSIPQMAQDGQQGTRPAGTNPPDHTPGTETVIPKIEVDPAFEPPVAGGGKGKGKKPAADPTDPADDPADPADDPADPADGNGKDHPSGDPPPIATCGSCGATEPYHTYGCPNGPEVGCPQCQYIQGHNMSCPLYLESCNYGTLGCGLTHGGGENPGGGFQCAIK